MNAGKITWLCGCLEPGRDGVGDYTRLLAGALARLGVEAQIIALHDPHVASAIDETGDEDINVLRLSAALPWSQRWEAAEAAIRRFDPEWVSLQFVCYGFHAKGLPYQLDEGLLRLTIGRKRHLMLHELWIGEAVDYGLKDRLMGWLQKRVVLGVIRAFAPQIMHTSNPVYAAMLARVGQRAEVLPLFGNVPLEPNPATEWFCEQLRERGIAITSANRHEYWIAGVFGTIHPQWSPDILIEQVATLAREQRKRPVFLALGRIGSAGKALWSRLAGEHTEASFVQMGDQPAARISQCLQNLDFGISPSPWALIGKSGTAAAMLDHGLPVVVGRDEWKLRSQSTPSPTSHPLLFREDEFPAAVRTGRAVRRPAAPNLSAVATQFRHALARVGDESASPALVTVGNSGFGPGVQ